VNDFIITRFQLFQSSLSRRRSVLVLRTPGQRCWHCDRKLVAGFCGVHASHTLGQGLGRSFLFITCSERCQRGVLEECELDGVPAQSWTGAEVRALLDDDESVAGVCEVISLQALLAGCALGRFQ
jgi:hypothetical protein